MKTSPPPKGIAARLNRALPSVVLIVILVAAWALAALFGPWEPYLFPGPGAVWDAIVRLALDGSLGDALVTTLRRLGIGFGISLVIGLLIALGMASSVLVTRAFKPLLLGLQSLPGLAWIPITIVWFGVSEQALLFVTVIGSVWAVAIAISDGLSTVPPLYFRAARNLGARGSVLVTHVGLPAALPVIVGGAKQSWAFAWRSLIGAEIIFQILGLGFLLNAGRDFLDVAQVLAVMVVTLFVGIAAEFLLFGRLEAWVRKRYGLVR